MKLTSILNNIISEVGEGSSNPYSYSVNDNVYGDHSQAKIRGPYFKVDFTTVDEYGYEDRADRVVNKGRLFRIMATIVAATKEFLNDIDYEEKGIKKMLVRPAKSRGTEQDDRRANLYMAYIKKQIPVSDIMLHKDKVKEKIKFWKKSKILLIPNSLIGLMKPYYLIL